MTNMCWSRGRRRQRRGLVGFAVALTGVIAAGCVAGPPHIAGMAGAPPTPADVWVPPASVPKPTPPLAADTLVSPELQARLSQLSLTDVVTLALRNNPTTRVSWAQARAAAASYGVQRGRLLPSVNLGVTGTESKTLSSAVRYGGNRKQLSPSISLSYLLFDMGGRAGARHAAQEAAFAASFGHNAAVQNVVLQVESSYFSYMSTRNLLAAQQASLKEARANLEAAQHRHDVGLATIADVLQAKTAVSQAQLALETTQGALATVRASLAVAMGLPANAPYDVGTPPQPSIGTVAVSVDTLIAEAVRDRPDLQQAEAAARGSRATVAATRAAGLPALTLNGNAGRVYSDVSAFTGGSYGVSLSLSVPIFSGFSQQYSVQGAKALADAAQARADGLKQQVVQQVFTSYYALHTATQQVRTADDLLASATESEQVARGRYQQGVGTIIDLLTAQRALADARAQQAQARWTWLGALARLAHDAGVLSPQGKATIPVAPDTVPGSR
jgi:outer membrane protein